MIEAAYASLGAYGAMQANLGQQLPNQIELQRQIFLQQMNALRNSSIPPPVSELPPDLNPVLLLLE